MKDFNQKANKKLHYNLTKQFFKNETLGHNKHHNIKKKETKYEERQLMICNVSCSILDKILEEKLNINKIIDVGCGAGDLSFNLAKQFPQIKKIVCIDFLRETFSTAKENAKQINQISFLQSDLLNIHIEQGSFDVTFCMNVLHHIHKDDFKHAIKELTRITDKYLIFDIRDKKNIYNLWFKYIGLPLFYSNLPVYTTSISEVNTIMKE